MQAERTPRRGAFVAVTKVVPSRRRNCWSVVERPPAPGEGPLRVPGHHRRSAEDRRAADRHRPAGTERKPDRGRGHPNAPGEGHGPRFRLAGRRPLRSDRELHRQQGEHTHFADLTTEKVGLEPALVKGRECKPAGFTPRTGEATRTAAGRGTASSDHGPAGPGVRPDSRRRGGAGSKGAEPAARHPPPSAGPAGSECAVAVARPHLLLGYAARAAGGPGRLPVTSRVWRSTRHPCTVEKSRRE